MVAGPQRADACGGAALLRIAVFVVWHFSGAVCSWVTSAGPAAQAQGQGSVDAVCDTQPCDAWDYDSAECWTKNSERCGWSCGNAQPKGFKLLPADDVLKSSEYAAATVEAVKSIGSGLRARVSGPSRAVLRPNLSFEVVELRLHLHQVSASSPHREPRHDDGEVEHKDDESDTDDSEGNETEGMPKEPTALKLAVAFGWGRDACEDHPAGWKDSYGDGCDVYESRRWCTRDGKPGTEWIGGPFETYENDGYTALTACCACGGGREITTTTEPVTTSTRRTTTRTTWRSTSTNPDVCSDVPDWVDSDGDTCEKYVQTQWCTPDGQPGRNWDGTVADFSRYENDGHTALTACCGCGGGVQPTTTTLTTTPSAPTVCVDDPEGWTDSEGDSCQKYVESEWCTEDGKPGPQFGGTVDDFSQFQNDGRTALTACCGCGGGMHPTTTAMTTTPLAPTECVDDPEGWTDSDGDDCEKYVHAGWCTEDGRPGPHFGGTVEDFSQFQNDGRTALTACCGCGGGMHPTTTTTPDASAECVDDPVGWVDSDGDSCKKYARQQWCTRDGPLPGARVEDYEQFENDGHTALTACCDCGGGSTHSGGGASSRKEAAAEAVVVAAAATPPPVYAAELHVVHVDRATSLELLLVVEIAAEERGGAGVAEIGLVQELLAVLSPRGGPAPDSDGMAPGVGGEIDLAAVVAAAGGLAAARDAGAGAMPPCRGGGAWAQRLVAARRLAAPASALAALAGVVRPKIVGNRRLKSPSMHGRRLKWTPKRKVPAMPFPSAPAIEPPVAHSMPGDEHRVPPARFLSRYV